MPKGQKRYQQARTLHYITFTCHHPAPHLETPQTRELFERTFERVRRWTGWPMHPPHTESN
jgi:uracil-DNA glycosylase